MPDLFSAVVPAPVWGQLCGVLVCASGPMGAGNFLSLAGGGSERPPPSLHLPAAGGPTLSFTFL